MIMRYSSCDMRYKILVAGFLCCSITAMAQVNIKAGDKGVVALTMPLNGTERNFVDEGGNLGSMKVVYTVDGVRRELCTDSLDARVSEQPEKGLTFQWKDAEGIVVTQTFQSMAERVEWGIKVENQSGRALRLNDVAFRLPVGGVNRKIEARHNLCRHEQVNLNASYFYWVSYDGQGEAFLCMPMGRTALEYVMPNGWYYLHSETTNPATMRPKEKGGACWNLPASGCDLRNGASESFAFEFFKVESPRQVEQAIYDHRGVNFRVVPGMVVPRGEELKFAVRAREGIGRVEATTADDVRLGKMQRGRDGFRMMGVTFSKLGVNQLLLSYGKGKRMMLDFFVTEPVETLIRKRSAFITNHQQVRDSGKWYDGLYSLYDMEREQLLLPDDMGDLREPYMVGGSDDPSNSKPVFVSEKNVAFPDSAEIASLEYYEKNFVWGKLQRTDKEYPYPYGIYGSDNWHQNRSGSAGDYGSGGNGRERMWRTFDYTTHIAIYYNLYRIAQQNPGWVHYLDANGYLDRAYHTAMAFFEVPYNIRMGQQWAFHGWCDWAYKQGNFHERYILDLLEALEENGKQAEADRLRYEWEKKVTYMVYEDEWPFGSEMFVDRTAFESSYYIGEYALTRPMPPHEQFWYDKNKEKWYSYKTYDKANMDNFMQNQLDANLALRGTLEPGFYACGTAYASATNAALDYMTQMGGVALLDYGTRFAERPEDFIRWGYNSLLGSWALMNTGDEASGYGYWMPGKQTDGAAGWTFSVYNHIRPYMPYLFVNRGPWRFDGEIDHGFTGGVHGQGCYLVNDPLFGEIAYGGRLVAKQAEWVVTPWDGTRNYIAIPQADRFEMRLTGGGFQSGEAVEIARDLKRIAFRLEQRGLSPQVAISLSHLPKGRYAIRLGEKVQSSFAVMDEATVKVQVPSGLSDRIVISREAE